MKNIHFSIDKVVDEKPKYKKKKRDNSSKRKVEII
jgi:hypothetical protein